MYKLVILLSAFIGIECFRLKRDTEQHHPVKHWGYRNQDRSLIPDSWHKSHPKCYGEQQSPINVELAATVYGKELAPLKIKEESINGTEHETWQVKNNGHSVVMSVKDRNFFFKTRPEGMEYKFLQMHFHWRGSEHYVDGHRFAGELHLVHQSVTDESKFAVIGFLLRQTNHDNENLKPLVNILTNIVEYGATANISDFSLGNLIPFNLKNYYRYSGSLTTPGCDEVVEWHLMDNPLLDISDEQILDFQSIQDKNGFLIITNSRPIQELNDRVVKRSFEAHNLGTKRKYLKSASGLTDSSDEKSDLVKRLNIFVASCEASNVVQPEQELVEVPIQTESESDLYKSHNKKSQKVQVMTL
ncbi:carbonic anhydrase 4-like [Brachionus plicatilis]|uniref:Carbonic anhydrase n=1 Tax=Brachionus plicatilis TaxID=10195 RepID=A0A3M7SB87_BRAPC|nr:carbonic anhydrase 4-like [Brachionus plicatilis]